MNDYITKPIEPKALSKVLDQWLPGITPAAEQPATQPAPAQPEPTLPVFERKLLLERVMNDEALLVRVQDSFLQDTPTQLAALDTQLSAGNLRECLGLVHRLKGVVANVAGTALHDTLVSAEKACKEHGLEGLAPFLPLISSRYGELAQAMRQPR